MFSKYCDLYKDYPIKEDCTIEVVVVFYILAAITVFVLALCIYNALLLFKNGKIKRVPLALFYLFSIISLLCKRV